MIQIENLKKVYNNGYEALKSINLEINDGELICLLGPSGCGKTTILNLLAGLLDPTDGDIKFDKESVIDKHPKDRNIGLVFQNYALYPHMTVYDNMAFALKLRKAPKDEIDRKVRDAAKKLDIEHLLDRKPKALSGGQRQRVALGRAIVREPKVFLMDEPLSNLDAKLRVQMRTVISKLYQDLATTFIYVTHDQIEALTMGTRIVVMKDGVIQQVDTPLNIYNTPNNLFVAGFIGSPQMNLLNGTVAEKDGKLFASIEGNNIEIVEGKAKILKDKGYVGKEVVFGIRPEHLDDNEALVKDNPTVTIGGNVEVVERMGSESYIYFKCGENSMTARVDGSTKFEPKDSIKLFVEKENIHVFDKESELRIC